MMSGESNKLPPEVPSEQGAWLRRLCWQAFLLRVAVAVTLHLSGASAWFAPDEETYSYRGMYLAAYWSGEVGIGPNLSNLPAVAYFYLNAVSYYVFDSVLPLKLVNAALGAMTCSLAFGLAHTLFGLTVARRTAQLMAFLPSLVLWSSINIRDVWVIWLLLIASTRSVGLLARFTLRGTLELILALVAIVYFRQYLLFVVALPPILALIIGRRGDYARGVLVALPIAFALVVFLQIRGAGQAAAVLDLEALDSYRRGLTYHAGSAYAAGADISSIRGALAFLPVGLAYFLFSPFPWQITSTMKLLSLPETLFLYWLTPAIVRGIRRSARYRLRECVQPLLLTALLTVSYSLGSGNVGTLFRHRAQAIPFFLMFAAVGRESSRSEGAQTETPEVAT